MSREENSLPCSTEWDKSGYFTPSNLLPKSVVKMKHLAREQRYGISLMLQEGKSRKDIAKSIGVSTSTISRELRKNCDLRNGVYNYELAQRKYETRLKFRGRKSVFTKEMKDIVIYLLEEGYNSHLTTHLPLRLPFSLSRSPRSISAGVIRLTVLSDFPICLAISICVASGFSVT